MDSATVTAGHERRESSQNAAGARDERQRLLETGYRVAFSLTGSAEQAASLLERCVQWAVDQPGDADPTALQWPAFLRRLIATHDAQLLGAVRIHDPADPVPSHGSRSDPAGASPHFAEGASGDRVWSALQALPRVERAAVALYCTQSCGSSEVAAQLGVTCETAREHLRQGRRRLREALAELLEAVVV